MARIILFGIARDIVDKKELDLELESRAIRTVGHLRQYLEKEFPKFKALNSFAIAVNEEYAMDSQELVLADVIAIIPPVSGG